MGILKHLLSLLIQFSLCFNRVLSIKILTHNTFWLFENYTMLNNNITKSIVSSPYYLPYEEKIEKLSSKYGSYDADVISLIEIDGYKSLSKLNEKLNNKYYNLSTNNVAQNVGLLINKDKYKIGYYDTFIDKDINRVLYANIYSINNMENYNIFVVHFKAHFDDSRSNIIRTNQFNDLYNYIDKHIFNKKNLVILGDFNEPELEFLDVKKRNMLEQYHLNNIDNLETKYNLSSVYKFVKNTSDVYSSFYDQSNDMLNDTSNVIYMFQSMMETAAIDNILIGDEIEILNTTLDSPLNVGDYAYNKWYSDHRLIYSELKSKIDDYENERETIKKLLKNHQIYDIINTTPKYCKYYLYGGTTRNIFQKGYSTSNDLDIKTNCNINMIYSILKSKGFNRIKKTNHLLQINSIQMTKFESKYFSDEYFNTIMYDIKLDSIHDTDKLAIYSAKNKIIMPFRYNHKSYSKWWYFYSRTKSKYGIMKYILRTERFISCKYMINPNFYNFIMDLKKKYYGKRYISLKKKYNQDLIRLKKSC